MSYVLQRGGGYFEPRGLDDVRILGAVQLREACRGVRPQVSLSDRRQHPWFVEATALRQGGLTTTAAGKLAHVWSTEVVKLRSWKRLTGKVNLRLG